MKSASGCDYVTLAGRWAVSSWVHQPITCRRRVLKPVHQPIKMFGRRKLAAVGSISLNYCR